MIPNTMGHQLLYCSTRQDEKKIKRKAWLFLGVVEEEVY